MSRTPRAKWTKPMLKTMRDRYSNELTRTLAEALGLTCTQVYQQAARMGLKKSAAFHSNQISGRLGHGQGTSTRFPKGHVPANKGLRSPGWAPGRMADTQFKKGRKPEESRNYRPIGSTRICRDGYLERKITDDPTIFPVRRWVGVHRLVWEAAHGPIPKGHIVRFKPGMKTTILEEIALDKLEMISLAENMKRNTIHNYPKEIVQVTQLRGAINRKINRLEKDRE